MLRTESLALLASQISGMYTYVHTQGLTNPPSIDTASLNNQLNRRTRLLIRKEWNRPRLLSSNFVTAMNMRAFVNETYFYVDMHVKSGA
jgi:hypothetical protein